MAIFTSFDAFITSTYGTTVGEGECWDYINLIWNHLGSKYWTYPPSDPSATNHGVKWGVLDSDARAANIISGLTYITDVSRLKRGDIVVTTNGEYGHAGFINTDYIPNQSSYPIYSQNYNARSVTLDTYSIASFGGAFRYDAWSPPVPPTPVTTSRSHFPFVLYARKLRGM